MFFVHVIKSLWQRIMVKALIYQNERGIFLLKGMIDVPRIL
jgi:hypothetical protein